MRWASVWCKSQIWRCMVRPGMACLGMAWPGAVGADDLSAEGFGPLRWVCKNPVRAGNGTAWLGRSRNGKVMRDLAWATDGGAEGLLDLPRRSHERLSLGVVRSGVARRAVVWCG